MAPVLIALLAGLLAAAAGMTAAAIRAKQLDKAAVVDVAWGAGFALIAVVVAVVGTLLDDGTGWRRWLVAAMVAVWGLRLAWHIRGRAVGEHGGREDPRYAEMLGGPPSQIGMGVVARRVFLVQGVVQWFVALPVMVGAVLDADWWPAVVAGVVVWAVGLFVVLTVLLFVGLSPRVTDYVQVAQLLVLGALALPLWRSAQPFFGGSGTNADVRAAYSSQPGR